MDAVEIKRNALFGKTMVAALEKREFAAYYCADKASALAKALELIPETDVVSWGGSASIDEIGLKEAVKARNKVINRELAKDANEKREIMRQALLCDTFIMSTNAMSEDGQLVNIDGNGNRVAALVYGPKSVVMIVGMNKICHDLDSAQKRARSVAAPINVQRFANVTTPCAKFGKCMDCNAPDTICCQVLVTRHCRPAGRIKIILVGENLGY